MNHHPSHLIYSIFLKNQSLKSCDNSKMKVRIGVLEKLNLQDVLPSDQNLISRNTFSLKTSSCKIEFCISR